MIALADSAANGTSRVCPVSDFNAFSNDAPPWPLGQRGASERRLSVLTDYQHFNPTAGSVQGSWDILALALLFLCKVSC